MPRSLDVEAGRPTRQEDKVFLNLAGEFAVASELNRRRVLASVTYGASKSADVFALSRDLNRVVRIEVKAAPKRARRRWIIGEKGTRPLGASADVFWVLVLFPEPIGGPPDQVQRGEQAPRFFVLSPKEVYDAWRIEADEFDQSRIRRGLGPFTGRGVPGVRLNDIGPHEGRWGKILSRLN